jgi:thiamine-monophosphate kinase
MLKPMPPQKKPRTTASTSGELALIERIRTRAAGGNFPRLKLGIGDDCAVLTPPPGHDLLVTTDLSLEGRHFRRDWHPPASIGHRTLARGLSDLAAMGAKPLGAFLSLAIPKSIASDEAWLNGFLDGLLTLAHHHNVPLAGGDTSESPGGDTPQHPAHILADITLLGTTPRNTALRRSGARPGDLLYLTGTLGGAATELAALSNPSTNLSSRPKRSAVERHLYFAGGSDHPQLYPQPRTSTGQALRHLATACIDLSDGLSTDLTHLCQASHVAAEIDAARLPLHPLTNTLTPAAALHNALHGGEDYELLFTACPTTKIPRSIGGVRVSCIGRIVKTHSRRPTLTHIDPNQHRTPLDPGGWEHLQ